MSGSHRLLTERDQVVEQLETLNTALHDFQIIFDHVWRNRNELFDLLTIQKEENEVIENCSCISCDEAVNSLAEAVQDGWDELQYDPNGASWNYLGRCGLCVQEQAKEALEAKEPAKVETEKPKARTTLFE